LGRKKILGKTMRVGIEEFLNSLVAWRFENETSVVKFADAVDDFGVRISRGIRMLLPR